MTKVLLIYTAWAVIQSTINIYQNSVVGSGKMSLVKFMILFAPVILASNFVWLKAFNLGIENNSPIPLIMGIQALLFVVMSTLLGILVLNQDLSRNTIIGTLVVLVGIFILNYKQ